MAGSLSPLPSLPSLFGGSKVTTADAIKRRRQLAEQLAQQATDGQGSGSMLGAIAKGLQGFAGGAIAAQDRRAAAEAQQKRTQLLADYLAGQGGGAPVAAGIPAPGLMPAPAPAPAPAASSGYNPSGKVPSFVASAGQPYGVSPSYMTTVADIESRGNPNAANKSGAKGLYQFMPKTAAAYGLSNPFDPSASADAAARLASDNRASLQRSLGRTPTDAELYLAHQQGAGGAAKLLANPDARAEDLVGRAAVVQNGGRPGMSAREFSGLWTDKYDQRAGGQRADAGPVSQADMPVANAQDASFLTGDRDPNGGFFIPPAVRATAPAGDPSGPLPGDAPAPPVSPDIAALLSRQPMGPAQGFVPPAAAMPQPAPLPDAAPAAPPQQVAQAPAIPSMAGAPAPVMPAPGPLPMNVPLPPQRPSDAALAVPPPPAAPAVSPADLPVPNAVPVSGDLGIDPNSPDAGAGAFTRRQGVDRLLGGLQDGLDRVFGGSETQARLDRQVAALGGAPQPSPRALQLAQQLAPAAATPPQALAPAGGAPAAVPLPSQGGGSGAPAQAAAGPAAAAPASGRGPAGAQALMGILNDPYASPAEQQFALHALQQQMDNSVQHIDLGDSIGIMDKRGNILRQIPKSKTTAISDGQALVGNDGKVIYSAPQKPMNVTEGTTLVDPNTGRPIFANPKAPESFTLSPGQTRYQNGAPVAAAPGGTPDGFDAESKLRSEFLGRTKDYAAVHDAYGRVLSAVAPREGGSTQRSPASDIALVYGYMKMLDPGSVVREGEFATAQNAGSVPERVLNIYNKAVKGEFLTPEQRADMAGSATRLYDQTRKNVEGEAERYRGLSTDYRVDPSRVVRLPDALKPPNLTAPAAPGQPAPAPAPSGVDRSALEAEARRRGLLK